jgi:hypothetical protein
MTDFPSDTAEIAKDISALQAYRDSRLKFNARVVEASRDQSADIVTALRSDATHQLAEFYFLLSGFGIKSVTEFDQLIERHNDYVSALLADARSGYSPPYSTEKRGHVF